jgi:uncharacterized Zn finger protein
MAYSYWGGFPRYVSAGEKRARAAQAAARLAKRSKGRTLAPVVLAGRKIASTFWGKAWCANLESYADFAHRLDRGRSYVRQGAVVDLQIESARVRSHVAGTRLYDVEVGIHPLEPARWKALVAGCGDRIESVVSLLEGRLPDEVLRLVTHRERGLFPAPCQISMTCTCPDWAGLCKHVAATLYGVGARLDERPELLFLLRGVDPKDLVHAAADRLGTAPASTGSAQMIEGDDLGALFGIELASSTRLRAAGRGTPVAGAERNAAKPESPRAKPRGKRGAGKKARSAGRKSCKRSGAGRRV